jgi:hypothetical protein
MKTPRILASLCAAALLVTLPAASSEAATGPKRLQELAQAQTQLLMADYQGPGQVASPPTCARHQSSMGVYLLPTLSFNDSSGPEQLFTCAINQRKVLLDLAGAVVTEDPRHSTSFYVLADGTKLIFTRQNLERICDDYVVRFAEQAEATLDGDPITGTRVSTKPFIVHVNRGADTPGAPFYTDSVGLGHPGRLAATYCGFKAELHLTRGSHTIVVNLFGPSQPVTFRYNLLVT